MDRRTQARRQLEMTRRYTNGLIAEFPADKRLFQPFEGANHLMWQVGHLARSTDFVLHVLDSDKYAFGDEEIKRFGASSTPKSDASAYPPFDEVRAWFNNTHETLLAMLDKLPDGVLDQLPPDEVKELAPNKFGMFGFAAWHEGVHAGQICTLRKALKLKPKFL